MVIDWPVSAVPQAPLTIRYLAGTYRSGVTVEWSYSTGDPGSAGRAAHSIQTRRLGYFRRSFGL